MTVEFTAHNIRLDDGTVTRPRVEHTIDHHPWLRSAKRVLRTVFPGEKSAVRLADLGCLEGGYAVEFARMGFQVLGIEVRENNFAACEYVKARTSLPNLSFARDDAWNIGAHGTFDAVFCCGLLYHLEHPRKFLQVVSSVTRKLLILNTHVAPETLGENKFKLSEFAEHEGLAGRWISEFPDQASFDKRDSAKWASWQNRRSFWIQREFLIQAIHQAGFHVVFEQFDWLRRDIAENMLRGAYRDDSRRIFVGIKTDGSV